MFSIILPAYKSHFLNDAIRSILEQTYSDFELIIVNDNPESNIKDIVTRFSDQRITLYENKENIGQSDLVRNWNQSIKYSKREFIIMASDDDVYDSNYLDEIVSLTKKFPHCNLFHCRIRYFDNKGKTIQISQPASEFETAIDFIYQRICWGRKQALQEFCFRRKTLENIGGFVNFPKAWYTDDATLAAMSINGVAYTSKVLFNMRMSGENISTGEKNIIEKIDAMKKYIHWLTNFIPTLKPTNISDEFMKQRLLNEFRNYLFSHYSIYLPHLSFSQYWKEYKYIKANSIFPGNIPEKMLIRRILKR